MPSVPKIERNEQILKLRMRNYRKYSWAVLGKMFKIHRSTVKEIFLREHEMLINKGKR